jgi:hypothetical protein
MPIETCELNGKPGYRWGQQGKCYTYEAGNDSSRSAAMQRAMEQARAIEASKHGSE